MMTYFKRIQTGRPIISVLLAWVFFLGVLLLPICQPNLYAQTCDYDYNSDGDTDGKDVYEFIQRFNSLYTIDFAAQFGSTSCDTECRDLLPCSMDEANNCFAAAVQAENHPVDRTYHSVTRILSLIYDPEINRLLTDLGIQEEARTFCNWTAGWNFNNEGEPILPDPLPSSGNVLRRLIDTLSPQIEGALDELAGIDTSIAEPFIILCEEFQAPDETAPCESIEVDYGDIAIYRAMLHFLRGFMLLIDAYDLNIDETYEFIQAVKSDVFVINDYLCDDDPATSTCLSETFLAPKDGALALLAEAKTAFIHAIDSYMDASMFIRNETDNQEDDMMAMPEDPEEIAEEVEFRSILSNIKDSMNGPTLVGAGTDTVDQPFVLDLRWFFDPPFNLRDNMPRFTDTNDLVCGSFDPTLGNILPNFDDDFWANGLGGIMVPLSGEISCADGIPCGTIGVGVFHWDWYSNSPGQLITGTSISSPGTYVIPVRADREDVTVAAYWDKDADGMLSPGDFTGIYPFGMFDVESLNCTGPDNINVVISDEVIGIKGQITCNGQPVPDIRVELHEAQCQGYISRSVTDANGYYVLTSSSTTPANIYINPDQYVGGWWTGSEVSLNCNDAAPFNPATGQSIVNIAVEEADTISGVIEDVHGNPIPWIQVQVKNYDGGVGSWIQGSSSNETGVYTLYLNQPYSGTCVVQAQDYRYNYIDEYYDNKRTQADATPIVMDPAPGVHHVFGIDFQLDEGGQISGVITDSSGIPISGISVSAYDYTTGDWFGGTSTQSDGSYVLSGLPTAGYRISVWPGNTDYLQEYYDNVRYFSSATEVNVTEGQMVSGIDFELEKGGIISGIVTRTFDNQPIENIRIWAVDVNTSRSWGGVLTDSNGAYRLTGLSTSSYKVYAIDNNQSIYQSEYYDNVLDSSSATALDLVFGQTLSGIDFSLEMGGNITGTVTRASDNQPIEGIWVWVNDYHSGNFIAGAQTNANGEYTVTGIYSDTCRVTANANTSSGYMYQYYDHVTDYSSAAQVTVNEAQTTENINFALDALQ